MNPKWQQIRRSSDVACFITLSHLNCCDVSLGIQEYHEKVACSGFQKKGNQLILYTYCILVDDSELSHKAGTFKSSKNHRWVFSPFANAQSDLHLFSSIRYATLKPEVENHGDMTCTTFRTHEME